METRKPVLLTEDELRLIEESLGVASGAFGILMRTNNKEAQLSYRELQYRMNELRFVFITRTGPAFST